MNQNILRGKILRLLHELYPDGIEYTSLLGIYYSYEKIESIKKALQYLIDRGLIINKEIPHPYKPEKKIMFYKISPSGIDLAEEVVKPIPGVCFIPEEDSNG